VTLEHVLLEMKSFVVREPHRAELSIQKCRLFVSGVNPYFCGSFHRQTLNVEIL